MTLVELFVFGFGKKEQATLKLSSRLLPIRLYTTASGVPRLYASRRDRRGAADQRMVNAANVG